MGVSLTLLRTPCTLASRLVVNIPHRWTLNIIKELMERKPVHTTRAIATMVELQEHHHIFNNNLTPGLNNQGVRCLPTLTMVAMDRLGIKLKHSSSRRQVYKWQHRVEVQLQMVQVSMLPTLFQPLQIIQVSLILRISILNRIYYRLRPTTITWLLSTHPPQFQQ